MTTRELLDAVLALSDDERADFRDELDASLPDNEEDEDADFVSMLDGLLASARAGTSTAADDEVLERLRARLTR